MNDRTKVNSVFDTVTADRINRKIYTNLKNNSSSLMCCADCMMLSTQHTPINIKTLTQEAKNQYLE
jgi:hypothetical protein